jgi:hypothetical protein
MESNSNQNFHPLIADIPDMDAAAADFNSVPGGVPPFRDVPSVLIGHLNRPNLTGPEPDWDSLLWYFVTKHATRGFSNLQDLQIFIVRIVLPRAVMMNREFMQEMYTRFPGLPLNCRLRFDSFTAPDNINIAALANQMSGPHLHPDQRNNAQNVIPLNGTLDIPTRPIFRSQQNPNGTNFRQWLHLRPNPLVANGPVPGQLAHRPSELDQYLDVEETRVRSAPMEHLLRRTIRALNIFWYLAVNNAKFQQYKNQDWAGIQAEF